KTISKIFNISFASRKSDRRRAIPSWLRKLEGNTSNYSNSLHFYLTNKIYL
uniref:Uncharacterized protein n=1 Tax=Otolemur garnettii TaxID=30611 RepID=H0XJW6_OTOGA